MRELVKDILKTREKDGGINSVVWIAAGGSYGGFYPAQYFMDREATGIRSQSFTSNEFVFAPPKFCGPNTLAVICSCGELLKPVRLPEKPKEWEQLR